MRKFSRWGRKCIGNVVFSLFAACALTGCGGKDEAAQQEEINAGRLEAESPEQRIEDTQTDVQAEASDDCAESVQTAGIAGESGADAQINFAALQEENPDIFAWIYIPGTDIDCPVLQSAQGDDFYENHNAYGQEDENGAVYIELANLATMCDFNTVMHGRTGQEEKGPFAGLYRFADPDFFDKHETLYLYLDGNVLTYEIFAAYERENTSLLRSYDFTYLEGCEQFLHDLYSTRDMTMNLREGWEGITPYHFLITLTTQREETSDKQFVVYAILTQDAAGTIDRIVIE